jgi:hypothetical protein
VAVEASERLPGRQQSLLEEVLGIVERPEDPVAVHVQLRTVGVGQLGERVAVSDLGAGERGIGHRVIPPAVDIPPRDCNTVALPESSLSLQST